MKKIKLILAFAFFISVQTFALNLDFSTQVDNFPFKDDGTIILKPDVGFSIDLNSKITSNIAASFKVIRIPTIGNLLKPRILFTSKTISFSFGPSIGILNKAHNKKELSTVFQPGFGIGMNVLTDKGFLVRFDIDFSIFTGLSKKNVYINNGFFEIGMRLPKVFTTLKVEQLTRTSTISSVTTSSITDASLNFEVFSKPSRFVFPLSCIFRLTKYKNEANAKLDSSFLSIVLKFGFTHNIYNDLSYYLNSELQLYNIQISGKMPNVFRYKADAGLKISFD